MSVHIYTISIKVSIVAPIERLGFINDQVQYIANKLREQSEAFLKEAKEEVVKVALLWQQYHRQCVDLPSVRLI